MSNNTSHTPGPWHHATDLGQVGSVEDNNGMVVATAAQIIRDKFHKTRQANAALIARAPELLAENERLLWLLSSIISDLPFNRTWLDPSVEREARIVISEYKRRQQAAESRE